MQGRQSDLFNYSEELKEGTARITDVVRAPITNAHADIKHPAMYPLTLAEFLIKSFSPETATILDPFAGSGTTGVAAKKAGRHFVGIEKKADYIKIIKARLKNAGATLV
jgi:DNA modification methylase